MRIMATHIFADLDHAMEGPRAGHMHVGPHDLMGIRGRRGHHLGEHGRSNELKGGQAVILLAPPRRHAPLDVLVQGELDGHVCDAHHRRQQPTARQHLRDQLQAIKLNGMPPCMQSASSHGCLVLTLQLLLQP